MPSLLSKLNQGHLAAALARYGEVYHANGPAKETLAQLRQQGVIPKEGSDDGQADFIIVASLPSSWDINKSCDDESHVPVGRGIYETIELFCNNCDEVNVTQVLFASAQDVPKGCNPDENNVYVRTAEYHDADLVSNGDWKDNYATYDAEAGQNTLRDCLVDDLDLERKDKAFRRGPTPNSTGVPDTEPSASAVAYVSGSSSGSLLGAAVRLGIVKMAG